MNAAARRFYRLARGVEVATTTVTREQALDVQFNLARNTPVDVGTARSNWRISVGRPLVGRINAYFPYMSRHKWPYGPGGKKSETRNVRGAIRQGQARLKTYTKGSIYVSNALPYIRRLDSGHSPQSKAGFVTRSILAATRTTRLKIPKIFRREFSK